MGILDRFRYAKASLELEARAPALFELFYELAGSRAQVARAGYGVMSGDPSAPGPLVEQALGDHCATTERLAERLAAEKLPAFLDRFRRPLLEAMATQVDATRRYLAGLATGALHYDALKEADLADGRAMDCWGALLPDRLLLVQPARCLPPGLFVPWPEDVPAAGQDVATELMALRRKVLDRTQEFDVLKPSYALCAWLGWYRAELFERSEREGNTAIAVALLEEVDSLNRYLVNCAVGRLAEIGTHLGIRLTLVCQWATDTWERSPRLVYDPPSPDACAQMISYLTRLILGLPPPRFSDPESLGDEAANRYPPCLT